MTIHEAIFSPVRQPLLGLLYLVLTAQMALYFASFRDGRSRRYRLACLLHLLFSVACLWFPFMDIDSNHFRTDVPIPLPAARSIVTSLPAWALFLYEALTAVVVLAAFRDLLRFRRDHLTADSIKETMDLLPAGIAFGKTDGAVVFSNLTMNRLSRALMGTGISNLDTFLEALPKAAGPAGAGKVDRQAALPRTEADSANASRPLFQTLPLEDPTGREKSKSIVSLPDGSSIWQISSEQVEVDGKTFTQLTATDITEQAAATRELEDKNKKLREIHLRLDTYNKQADRIIIAQELLTARMAVHSEVGNVLLESRHYLTDPASFEEEKLLQALKNTNTYLLREYEEDDTARDTLTDAVEMAEAIGVDVLISGPVPQDAPYRQILAAAINECASNTVKHAGGNQLTVQIRRIGNELAYTLTSNGEAPTGAIQETGGLLTLRTLVENEGGKMQTEHTPKFMLRIGFTI